MNIGLVGGRNNPILGLTHEKFNALYVSERGLSPRWARQPLSKNSTAWAKNEMANPQVHTQTRDQSNRDEQDRKAAEGARTVRDETAKVGEQSARAGADIARRGAETARDAVQTGVNMATQTLRTDQ